MDATANEASGLFIRFFPTIKLYKKDEKLNPIEFEGKREISDLI